MPIRLHNVRARLDVPEDALSVPAAERLAVDAAQVAAVRVVRRAIDARRRPPVFVYTIDVALSPKEDESAIAERAAADLVANPQDPVLEFASGAEPLPGRPMIVGAGPAGLFAAYLLAQHGFRPLVVERGQSASRRTRDVDALFTAGRVDPESNILFGLGGAGMWAGGKLGWSGSDPMAEWVLRVLVRAGAPERILVDARPRVETNVLHNVIAALARQIEDAGGEFRFSCRADSLLLKSGRVAGVRCADEAIEAGAVILAIGHSARDTFRVLADQGVALEARPFQIGVRIEHQQEIIDRCQYGEFAGHPRLPAAEYSLQHKARGGWRSVHTFYMCPRGTVIPAVTRDGELCTSGMSSSTGDGTFANAALIVSVSPKDFGDGRFDGVAFQERIERAAFAATGSLSAPAQRARDFVADHKGAPPEQTSYPLGVVPVQFSRILPRTTYHSIVRALAITFDRAIRGFAGESATVLGPETRVSSPIRILRDEASRESLSTPGLFPVGEGSGYAGGIMNSALDGVLTARAIIERYRP